MKTINSIVSFLNFIVQKDLYTSSSTKMWNYNLYKQAEHYFSNTENDN